MLDPFDRLIIAIPQNDIKIAAVSILETGSLRKICASKVIRIGFVATITAPIPSGRSL